MLCTRVDGTVGISVGAVVGIVVGYSVGTAVGATVGSAFVGLLVVGATLGCPLPEVGTSVLGLPDGEVVGLDVVGFNVLGPAVGVAVG